MSRLRRAEQIVERGSQEVGLEDADLASLPRGDPRRGLIAHAVMNATLQPLDRIAETRRRGVERR